MSTVLRLSNQWNRILDPRDEDMYLYTRTGVNIECVLSEIPMMPQSPRKFPLGGTIEILRSDKKYYTYARASSAQSQADNGLPVPTECVLVMANDPDALGNNVEAELAAISKQLLLMSRRIHRNEMDIVRHKLEYDWFVREMLIAVRHSQEHTANAFVKILQMNKRLFAAERLIIDQLATNRMFTEWIKRVEADSKFQQLIREVERMRQFQSDMWSNNVLQHSELERAIKDINGTILVHFTNLFGKVTQHNKRIFALEAKIVDEERIHNQFSVLFAQHDARLHALLEDVRRNRTNIGNLTSSFNMYTAKTDKALEALSGVSTGLMSNVYRRLAEHNNRIFSLELLKYTHSREHAQTTLEQAAQDRQITEINDKVARNASAIELTRIENANTRAALTKEVRDIQGTSMVQTADLFGKMLEHNNRLFELETGVYQHTRVHAAQDIDKVLADQQTELNRAEIKRVSTNLAVATQQNEADHIKMNERAAETEGKQQAQVADVFARILDHNNRLFGLEAKQYTHSREHAQTTLEQAAQDRKIEDLQNQAVRISQVAEGAHVASANTREILSKEIRSVKAQALMANTNLFSKALQHNNRIFSLESVLPRYSGWFATMNNKIDKVVESQDQKVDNVKAKIASVIASVAYLTTKMDELKEKIKEVESSGGSTGGDTPNPDVPPADLERLNTEFNFLNNSLNMLASAVDEAELNSAFNELLKDSVPSMTPTLIAMKKLISDLHTATKVNEDQESALAAKIGEDSKLEIGASSLSQVASMLEM